MVVGEPNINNIMGGIENTGSVRLHNHRKKLKQRFDIIKKLGQGTYGKVQLGINKETGQEVAIKTIKKSKIETEADLVRIRREIQIMSSVQHPNIIHIYEVFENREKMVLVMEYAAGGELYDYLSERKVLAEEEARRIFRQIATACYYCHKHKICHRDLKLENILLDEHGNAKIADFGLSNVFDDQRLLSTFCGSPLYASPEIVKGTPYQGPEVDCWSLGVLLYTLVYGAMPFDGSNFKRLVRQISQGDYFEPKKPSRASPLIRDMLTVNPRNRANIEKICAHWWVNEGYEDSCLEISEELANQTPVRLDLLLSLAPPAPQLESEKLVVTGEGTNEAGMGADNTLPARSQSAGSLMDIVNPAERRIKDLLSEDVKVSPKRKLETTVSTDQVNLAKDGVKRKDKIIKENTVADITLHAPIQENASLEDASMAEEVALNKSATQTISREMDVESAEDLAAQGAACAEILEDAKKNEAKKAAASPTAPVCEEHEKEPPMESQDKENQKKEEEKKESKIPAKRKIVKKKVLTDKNENAKPIEAKEETPEPKKPEKEEEPAQPPSKPVERRRSRIFETAEKFQNMISANQNSNAPEKPKKIVIPGVSVGGYKKEFERKASLTSTKPLLTKKPSVEEQPKNGEVESPSNNNKAVEKPNDKAKTEVVNKEVKVDNEVPSRKEEVKPVVNDKPVENEASEERKVQVKNAVNIISNALDGTRKSKSRPCMTKKPPVPFGVGGRSASGSISSVTSPLSPPGAQTPLTPPSPTIHSSTPAQVLEQTKEETPEENKTSSAEITLKSATLPRRKTTKAEIKLDYPTPKPATMGFKTEMAHHIEAVPPQRNEVTFPIPSPTGFRSASVEPDVKKQSPRERIIPIAFEGGEEERRQSLTSPPVKPPTTPSSVKSFVSQRSAASQRSNSLSRQSTQESDSETTTSAGEPIRKSPREYIIPIAVEGGGYVTPRAGSLEPSDTTSTTSTMTSKSKFGRSRLNDREGSEDESPFTALHRHSSFGRDSDTEDPRRDMFRMHSLRSSRPRRTTIEHNDSFSSGEDDDDDGFEILTAENLFSTLLSRVRDLTQRLNVDGRPGFPTSRLLSSHFDHDKFWSLHNRTDPMSRFGRMSREQSVESSSSARGLGAPWRRSVSRDLATDIESVFNNSVPPPTQSATLPRGDAAQENLNLSDLDLKKLKLSDEDALALSFLTPGLSRRIQKQLLAQLAPSEARKLSRTMSMPKEEHPSAISRTMSMPKDDHHSATLPRLSESKFEEAKPKSFLPVKSRLRSPSAEPKSYTDSSTSESLKHDEPSRLGKYLSGKYTDRTERSYGEVPRNERSYSEAPRSYAGGSKLEKMYGEGASSALRAERATSLFEESPRTERASSVRRTSRFLRPDFYDSTKDNNYYLKEKKERELETQKVLKEIRDKRKSRLRERSQSKEKEEVNHQGKIEENGKSTETSESSEVVPNKETNSDITDLENVETPKLNDCNNDSQDHLKNVSDNIKNIETKLHDYVNVPSETKSSKIPDYVNVVKKERPSKIARPKSYPTESPEKEPTLLAKPKKEKKEEDKKCKLLHCIEKKFEKLRSFSNSPTSISSDDAKKEEKKSMVEDTIKRLREQSLPRNMDHCITESGLIKRAVSVEDLTASDPKQLQASRKSVTKILNLFKRYEDKKDKSKPKKSKEEKNDKKKEEKKKKHAEEKTEGNKTKQKVSPSKESTSPLKENEKSPDHTKKLERPRSLLLDKTKQYQPSNSSESALPVKRVSKLPVTSNRRSLNLENSDYSKLTKNEEQNHVNKPEIKTPDDLEKPGPSLNSNRNSVYTDDSSKPSTSFNSNRNSVYTDDSSAILSPCEDNISDTWSICSDYHHDITSPVSPCSHFYSADENESVSDRIRRKSFYTRFNEKKRPRKSTLGSYRDLDLYRERKKPDYFDDRLYGAVTPEPFRRDYMGYTRHNTTGMLHDGYQTYNPRFARRAASVYEPDFEEAMDDAAAGINRMYSYYNEQSRFNRPLSPSVPLQAVSPSVSPTVHSSASENLI